MSLEADLTRFLPFGRGYILTHLGFIMTNDVASLKLTGSHFDLAETLVFDL